jgi:hypothetical protein
MKCLRLFGRSSRGAHVIVGFFVLLLMAGSPLFALIGKPTKAAKPVTATPVVVTTIEGEGTKLETVAETDTTLQQPSAEEQRNLVASSKQELTTSADTSRNKVAVSKDDLDKWANAMGYADNMLSISQATIQSLQKEVGRFHFGFGGGVSYVPPDGLGVSVDLSLRKRDFLVVTGVEYYPAKAILEKDAEKLRYHMSVLYEF